MDQNMLFKLITTPSLKEPYSFLVEGKRNQEELEEQGKLS